MPDVHLPHPFDVSVETAATEEEIKRNRYVGKCKQRDDPRDGALRGSRRHHGAHARDDPQHAKRRDNDRQRDRDVVAHLEAWQAAYPNISFSWNLSRRALWKIWTWLPRRGRAVL